MVPRRLEDTDLSEFGRAVESWRREQGLTQAVLAKLIGTHQRTLSDWLRKDGIPGAVHQVAKLAALMGASVEGLVGHDAELAPLRDPKYVRDLLARIAPPKVLKRYAKQKARPGGSQREA
jgi:transcriptional regulator with XRE-family HTH domain